MKETIKLLATAKSPEDMVVITASKVVDGNRRNLKAVTPAWKAQHKIEQIESSGYQITSVESLYGN